MQVRSNLGRWADVGAFLRFSYCVVQLHILFSHLSDPLLRHRFTHHQFSYHVRHLF
jgi:hypothetical protein